MEQMINSYLAVDVRQPHELMRDNMIVKHLAGSHSYGTAIATSDVDYRGIFVGDPINIRTPFFPIYEADDELEQDTKLYEVSRFMKLALDANPNVIETLWVDDADITFRTPAYDVLRQHRHDFLSSKIAFTTSGYAISQLKRIKGHNKWIMSPQPEQPPQMVEFVSMVQHFPPVGKLPLMPRDFDLRKYHQGCRLIPFGKDIYGLYGALGYQTFNSNTGSLNDEFDGEDRSEFGIPMFVVKFNRQEYVDAKTRWDSYWEWKRNRNVVRSELEEAHGYDCHTGDTEFLTNTGWKRFDDVLDTDNLATFNEITHKIEYQAPTEKIDSLYTGNLYHLTGHHVDTLVTANHNMFVRPYSRTTGEEGRWQYQRAAELAETFDTLNAIVPRKNRQLLPPGFNADILHEIDMLNYLRLVGWYISDGTMQFYENGSVKHMMISQSKPQSKLTQTLTKQINSGKIKCNLYTYEPGTLANYPERRWIFNRSLSQIIFNDCGHMSGNKRLPAWVYFLTKREMTTLLVALIQGDGTKRDHQRHTYVYYTVNKLLADDVQRLAFLCGYETSLYGPYPFSSSLTDKEQVMHHVHINMRPRLSRRHVRSAAVEKIKVTNHRIVCFMVKNWTLVTRRNGQIGLHGNTKHAMHLVRLLRMGVEALTDGVINVKRTDAAELLSIRDGAWTYEEVVQYAEEMDDLVRNSLYKRTSLRKAPDVKLAAAVLMQVQDMVWSSS